MSLPPFNTAPRKSLVAHVESQIRDALVEGRLAPGTRLVTKELAASLDVSITPAREALVRFVASGVLAAEPAASFRVPYLDAERFAELAVIRKRVEGLAAEIAAQKISDQDIAEMEERTARLAVMAQSGEMHGVLKENHALRFFFYEKANMPTLLDVVETLWLRAGPAYNLLFRNGDRRLDVRLYTDLVEALKRRDTDGARRAIEEMIELLAEAVQSADQESHSRSA